MDANGQINTADLLSMARRRALPAAGVAAAVFLAAIFVAAVLPNRYEAWSTLLVSPQVISKKLVEPGLEESDLNNRLHLMTMQILSRGRLSKIIDDLGLYAEESKSHTREEVIEKMRNAIRVEPVLPELEANARRDQTLEINTFRLYFRSDSPDVAASVAQRLANDFIDEHIRERVEVSTGTSEFIEAELDRLAGEIRQIEEQIGSVKNENSGSLPEHLDANQRLLERAVGDLRLAQRDLAIAESDAAFYRQQAVSGAADRFRNSALADTPLERKQRVEIALGEARARGFTDKHPEIIAYLEELAALEEKIQADEDGVGDETLSPEQTLSRNEAKRAELRADAAREEISRLQTQVDDVQQRIDKIPVVAEQLAALERVHEHLYESYQSFSAKRLDAGVSANMERRQKGEQFRVLESAFPPGAPTSPNRKLIVFLGLLLGLAAGAGSALLLELADTSVHGARELQSASQVPVLASIPRVLLAQDRARMRRRQLLAGGLAAGVAVAVLLGAGAGYWVVNLRGRAAPQAEQGGGAATQAPAAPQAPQG